MPHPWHPLCWNPFLALHQPCATVKQRQHFVSLSRWQIEDQPGYTDIAIALDQVWVLSHAEDRDRDGRGVAPGRRRHLLKVGQKIEHLAIGWPASVWHPAVAIGDSAAGAVGIGAAH